MKIDYSFSFICCQNGLNLTPPSGLVGTKWTKASCFSVKSTHFYCPYGSKRQGGTRTACFSGFWILLVDIWKDCQDGRTEHCKAVPLEYEESRNLDTHYSVKLLSVYFLCCWPSFSINLCNKDQLDALFILSLFRESTSTCFGHIFSLLSGDILCIYNTYQLLYIYSILPDDGLQIWPKHVEVDWRNKLRINSASSWFLLQRYSTYSLPTFRDNLSVPSSRAKNP